MGCVFSGCAARLEAPRGDTWILGFSRVSSEIKPLNDRQFVAVRREQRAPLEIGWEPYGISAGLGLRGETAGYLNSTSAAGLYLPPRAWGLNFGSGEFPWTLGAVHFRLPRAGSLLSMRFNTVRGMSVRLSTEDPEVRLGFSETGITAGESPEGVLQVDYDLTDSIPRLTVSELQN